VRDGEQESFASVSPTECISSMPSRRIDDANEWIRRVSSSLNVVLPPSTSQASMRPASFTDSPARAAK
jgi:hypothetical protein